MTVRLLITTLLSSDSPVFTIPNEPFEQCGCICSQSMSYLLNPLSTPLKHLEEGSGGVW